MKRIALILAALFLAVPLFAADADAIGDISDRLVEKAVPGISKSQKRPTNVATQDEVRCGQHPAIPPNCHYKCRNGVPVLNPDGSQRVICYSIPEFPCNQYYTCSLSSGVCNYNGSEASYCAFEWGWDCMSCDW
ncbi:MAG TPA: hypothetical protein VEK57_15820 [Thermoanaerobaculia bacterium]|nr:hypothetical protein [Thermoanaerobaculia bacterium]